MLTDDRVKSFAVVTFGRFNRKTHLLAQRAGEKSAHAVGLPIRSGHQFVQGGSSFSPEEREDLGLLATFAGTGGIDCGVGLSRPPRLLRRDTGRLFAYVGVEVLNSAPDAENGHLPAGELLDRVHTRQCIPNFRQPGGRPFLGQARQFFRATKSLGVQLILRLFR